MKRRALCAYLVGTALSTPAFAQATSVENGYYSSVPAADRATFQTPEFFANWGLAQHNFDAAYAAGATGQGVTLGQLDTPLFAAHPEMAGISLNTFNGSTPALDGDSRGEWHGQHVGGLAVARKDGKGMHGGAYGSSTYFNADFRSWSNISTAQDYLESGASFVNHSYGYDLPDYRKKIFGDDGALIGLAASNLSDLRLQSSLDAVTKSSLLGVVNVTAAGNDRLYAATYRALNKFDARPRLFRGISVGSGMAAIAAGTALPSKPWTEYGLTEEQWLQYFPNYQDSSLSNDDWRKLEKNVAVAVMLNGTSEISSYSALCGISKYSCVGTAGGMLAEPHQDYRVKLPDMPLDVEYYYPGPDGISYIDAPLSGEIWASQYRMLSLATKRDASAGSSNQLRPIYEMAFGTSMASPMLMAGLAVTKSRFPYLENWQIRDIVYTTSRDIGAEGIDRVYGWGEMDLEAAMGGPRKLYALKRNHMEKLREIEIQQAKIYDRIVAKADNFATRAYELKVQIEEKNIEAGAAEQMAQDSTAPQTQRDASAATAQRLRAEIAQLEPEEAAARSRAYELELTRIQPNLPEDTEEAAFESIVWNVNLPGQKSERCNSDACIADLWANDIDGPGGLNKLGDGVLILSGTNSYQGGTIISGGVLQIGIGEETGTVSGDIVNNATLAYARSNEWDYEGNISGTGKIEVYGGGTLRLSGENTYTGNSVIQNGKLAVDGSSASVAEIFSSGILGGAGSVGGIVAHGGGIVAPGNSIGVLVVSEAGAVGDGAGNATFEKGSVFAVEIADNGRSDRLAVEGKTTLLGGAVMVSLEGKETVASASELDAHSGNRYRLLTSEGGVHGAFDELGFDYLFIETSLAYGAGYVDLAIDRRAFAEAGETFNQRETAEAIEALGAGNAVYGSLVGLTIDDDAPTVLAALSGEIHASLQGVLVEDGRFLREAANSRVRGTLGGIVTTTAANKLGGDSGLAPAIWGQAFGSWGSIVSDGNANELDRNIGGFLAGVDGDVANDWRLGLVAGYANSSLRTSFSSADIDSYQIGVYGGARWEAIGLSFGTAYGRHEIDTTRSTLAGSVNADYSADSVQIFGEAGYTMDTTVAMIEPFAGLAYTHLETNNFNETGGVAALSGFGDTTDITTTTLGLRASRPFMIGNGSVVTVSGMIGWRHAFGDVTPEVALAFAGAGSFLNKGLAVAEDALALEAGFDVDLSANARLGLYYNGQISDRLTDNSVKANLSVKF